MGSGQCQYYDDEMIVKLESVANRGDGGEPGLEAEAPK